MKMTIFLTSRIHLLLLLVFLSSCNMIAENFISKDFFNQQIQMIALDSVNPRLGLIATAIPTIDINSRGADIDSTGLPISYSCSYDTTIDGNVLTSNNCSTLATLTFDSTSGFLNWTPDTLGTFEFKIIGKNANAEDQQLFTITVLASNNAPSLDPISSSYIGVGHSNSPINAGDSGDDFDSEGHPIYYQCYFDTTIDGNVATANKCETLSGLSFNPKTGVINWIPSSAQEADYEFKIIGTDTLLSSEIIFPLYVVTPFVSRWRTTANGESITLPLRSGYVYDFTVDWGDGSKSGPITAYNAPEITHNYPLAGDYTITIIGKVEAWNFGGAVTKTQIIAVDNLGSMRWKNLGGAFSGCTNLTSFSGGKTNLVTDMSSMFQGTTLLESLDISSFNTSSVTTMSSMFKNSGLRNHLDLTHFNVANVTSTDQMFSGMNRLTSLNVSGWTNPLITSMASLFSNMTSLTSLNLSGFLTPAVTNMTSMFTNNPLLTSLDLSSFSTSLVTDMSSMFSGDSSITSLDLSTFNTSVVTTMHSMFRNMANLTNLNISSFDTANVTTMGYMFSGLQGLTNLDLSTFNTSSLTDISYMFQNSTGINTLSMANWSNPLITNMNFLFSGMNALSALDLTNFNTSAVTSMASMFNGASALTSLNLSSFNTASVASMASMFAGASSLTVLDLSSFNTSAVTDMGGMFSGASSLNSINLSSFNTSGVTLMGGMFKNTSSLLSVNLSLFDTSSVTQTVEMFRGSGVTTLDLSNFNTSAITTMMHMFSYTPALTSLNLNGWDISLVTNYSNIFLYMPGTLYCDQGGSPGTGAMFGKACN